MELHIDFNTVPAITLSEIRKNAEQFAFMVNQREQQALFDVIDEAVAEGRTPGALASIISDTFSDGYHVTDSSGVVKRYPTEVWSKMVARTELSRAQTMGNIALYQAAEIRTVMWATSQGDNVCPECEERDGEVYAIENIDAPPLHPNCACALMPADEDVAYRSQEVA